MSWKTIALASIGVLAGIVGAAAWAQDATELRDAHGRLIESVSEDGTRVTWIYDADGNLQEARYADGRVEHFEPVSSSD